MDVSPVSAVLVPTDQSAGVPEDLLGEQDRSPGEGDGRGGGKLVWSSQSVQGFLVSVSSAICGCSPHPLRSITWRLSSRRRWSAATTWSGVSMTSAKRSRAWTKSKWRFLHTCGSSRNYKRSRITNFIQFKQSTNPSPSVKPLYPNTIHALTRPYTFLRMTTQPRNICTYAQAVIIVCLQMHIHKVNDTRGSQLEPIITSLLEETGTVYTTCQGEDKK